MNFKLENFFIGVVELFAIILPGSIMTFFLYSKYGKMIFCETCLFPEIVSDYSWAAFLIAAYIIGHIINAIGSRLLDDLFYDKFEIWKSYSKNNNLTHEVASKIKEKYLKSKELTKNIKGKKIEVMNTFKWIKRYLSIYKPEAYTEVCRFEADQKFFRSLTIVFFILGIWLVVDSIIKRDFLTLIIGIICLFFALLSILRYEKLRFQTTETAYQYIITIYYNNNNKSEK